MNWGGALAFFGLLVLGIVTFPMGLPVLVFLAWLLWISRGR